MKKCEICGLEFENGHQLGGHKVQAHSKKKCEICGEEISSRGFKLHLWRHEIEQNDISLNKCEKCGTGFYNKPFHSKRFCSLRCSNSRRQSNETKEKIRSKLKGRYKSKAITCDFCGETFKSRRKKKYCSKTCASAGRSRKLKLLPKSHYTQINNKRYSNGYPPGGGYTKWLNYNKIKVQGSYEFRMCKILDVWKERSYIKDWEYTKDNFKYLSLDGKIRRYLLDFKVTTNNNKILYIETKGRIVENDEYKWRAVRNKGFRLNIVNNNGLCKYEKIAGIA